MKFPKDFQKNLVKFSSYGEPPIHSPVTQHFLVQMTQRSSTL